MSESSGSILQLSQIISIDSPAVGIGLDGTPPTSELRSQDSEVASEESSEACCNPGTKVTALSKINLLIVTSKTTDIQAIASPLSAANINFTYELIAREQLNEFPQRKYSAIIYDYVQDANEHTVNSLIQKLQCWCHLYPHTPLILITDPLGDEQAVKLIQSGVSGYVLRNKLDRLPDILEETLFKFVSQQAINTQQEDLIKQQEKIQQLEAQKQSWQDEEKIKQEHISHLIHELRNPISAIIGFAGMLKEEYYGTLNSKQMQYASLLHGSGEHLLALVKNYLEIIKIDANKQSLELERIAVVEICQASIYIVADRAKEKGLELDYELEDNIDFCTADSLRIKQILINLLSNAIKFTDKGSVTLRVNLKGGQLYFAVIDTGSGISAKNIAKLFKPFPQITNHYDSTGLGLTLSKKLAQLHGGDITVTSKLDKGSCFTLRIPQYQ